MMARIEVTGGALSDGRIEKLMIQLSGLPDRTLTREQAVAWMRDGHSFIPVRDGRELPALQLVEIANGDDVARFIRADTVAEPHDSLPFTD